MDIPEVFSHCAPPCYSNGLLSKSPAGKSKVVTLSNEKPAVVIKIRYYSIAYYSNDKVDNMLQRPGWLLL